MPLYGYARMSSEDQDLSIQIEKLKAAGCEIIRSEKRTGTTRESRRELETLLEFLRSGDTLVVTRSSRPEEFHPQSLTEPCLTLSCHTALRIYRVPQDPPGFPVVQSPL